MEIRIEKNWQAISVLVVVVIQLTGAAWWGTSVWLELRDARISQQNQVRLITGSVDKLTGSLERLTETIVDHEKRISIHDIKIHNLENRASK